MDQIDRRIVELLQDDGRITHAEIARRVDRAPSAVHERIRSLEEEGVILGYHARIRPAAVDLGLLAFIAVRSTEFGPEQRVVEALTSIPEVQEVHDVAGDDCFLIKVRARDTESLGELLRDRIGCIESVVSTRTTIVLRTDKETPMIPLSTATAGIATPGGDGGKRS